MATTREITVFSFTELSEESSGMFGTSPRQRARELVGQWLQEDANEGLEDWFAAELKTWGFPTDKIEWSLGCSQGDGMAFYGDVDLDAYCKKVGILRRTRPIRNADASVTIERNSFGHHYSHWNTMSVTVEYHGTETDRRNALRDELQERIAEDVKQVSRELERQGYAALEVTDEMIKEHCEANEIVFHSSGNLAQR